MSAIAIMPWRWRLGLQQCRKIALIAEFKPWFSFSTATELNLPILPRQSRWDIRFLVWDVRVSLCFDDETLLTKTYRISKLELLMRPSSWGCTLPVNVWTLVLNYINFSGYYMSESAYSTFKFAPHGTRFCIKSSNFQRKSEVWGWPTDWHLTSHDYRPFQFKLSAFLAVTCVAVEESEDTA